MKDGQEIKIWVTDEQPVVTANEDLVYDGTEHDLITVTEGTTIEGTLYYALGENDVTAPVADTDETEEAEKKWSTTIPTGTDAGTYYVWYKVI